MTEQWVVIYGYHKWEVSNLGQVRHFKGRVLKTTVGARGYKLVTLDDKTWLVHRLVALHFVEAVPGKPLVNHVDGDSLNNRADNLEWCTQSENMRHYWRLKKQSIMQGMITKNYVPKRR